MYMLKVCPSATSWRLQRVLTSCGTGESYRHATTISTLSDDVLLEIFDFCRETLRYNSLPGWKWHLLVHVCRGWRQTIFESPHRLNLRILCTYGTPVRKDLGIWPPAFPIAISYGRPGDGVRPNDEDNVIAALEHPNRVCHLWVDITGSLLGRMVTVMQEPFPVLTCLFMYSKDGNAPVLPGGFLGGSAPCLQTIYLDRIPFPALPTLLLSTSDLVVLSLRDIPRTGYVSPEAMVACLAALPKLESLIIMFQSATPRRNRIRPPPVTQTVLPALAGVEFTGASEYLEDLVFRIDSPQLDVIFIYYLDQFVDLQAAQVSEFIGRSLGPKLTLVRHAEVTFSSDSVVFEICRHGIRPTPDWRPAATMIPCDGIDRQVSQIAQVLSQYSATLSNVVHLELKVDELEGDHELEGMDDVEWLHLFHQFSAVQTLYVSWELAGSVALALEDITGEMVAEVLPFLDYIFLEDQPASSIEEFVAARRLSDRPVTVVKTHKEFIERLESYVSK